MGCGDGGRSVTQCFTGARCIRADHCCSGRFFDRASMIKLMTSAAALLQRG